MHFRQKIPDPKIDSLAPARSVAPQPSAPPNSSRRFPSRSNLPHPALSPRRGGIIRRRLAATSDRTGSWSQCMRKNRKGALHEPPPQRATTFESAAAGALLPRTQPRSVCQPVHGPNAREKDRKETPMNPIEFSRLEDSPSPQERENYPPMDWYDERSFRFRGSMRNFVRRDRATLWL